MKTLTGYVIAESLETDKDIIVLASGYIHFNKADALEKRRGAEEILEIKIDYPQTLDQAIGIVKDNK